MMPLINCVRAEPFPAMTAVTAMLHVELFALVQIYALTLAVPIVLLRNINDQYCIWREQMGVLFLVLICFPITQLGTQPCE